MRLLGSFPVVKDIEDGMDISPWAEAQAMQLRDRPVLLQG
jgi:hypothetical protein